MNKQEQIEQRLAKPVEIGDDIVITIKYKKPIQVKVGRKFEVDETDEVKTMNGIVKDIIDHPKHGRVYKVELNSVSVPSEVALPSEDFESSPYGINLVKAEWVSQSVRDCGSNPFKERVRVNFILNR